MLYEPTDPISFLYQSERGPKREHENNGTYVSAWVEIGVREPG